ncbi:hypothetical protein [Nocardioides sp.]|uniref:hypothetical protein n=1 Tax=Nocardioides sp. TaxID=35761 RepID=UPI003783164B
MRRAVLVVLCWTLAAVGLAAVDETASADAVTHLPLTGFADMAPDVDTGRLYVSDGESSVYVLDLDGSVVGELHGLPVAGDLVLSPDHETLWVGGVRWENGIVAVEVDDLSWTAYTDGVGCATDLAVVEGKVWFARGCTYDGVGVLDPADGAVAPATLPDLPGWFGATTFASDPAVPGALFVGTSYQDEQLLRRYDVTWGEAPVATLVRTVRAPGAGDGVTFSQQGQVVSTPGTDFRTANLRVVERWASSWGNVAVSPSGMRATGAEMVLMWEPGNPNPFASWHYDVRPGGLVWVGEQLKAIARTSHGSWVLRSISVHATPRLDIDVRGTPRAYGTPVVISVFLQFAPPHAEVVAYAEDLTGARRRLTSGLLDDDQRVQLTFPLERTGRVVVVFAGDEGHDAVEKAVRLESTVGITATTRGYRSRDGKTYVFGVSDRAVVTYHVKPNHAGDCMGAALYYQGQWLVGEGGRGPVPPARLGELSTGRPARTARTGRRPAVHRLRDGAHDDERVDHRSWHLPALRVGAGPVTARM